MALAVANAREGHTMQTATDRALDTPPDTDDAFVLHLLQGYRFSVCRTPWAAAAAVRVRRRIYVDTVGYQVRVPDEYDHRSWLLMAEDLRTRNVVGTARVTPRFGAPIEAEEYFTIPRHLASSKTFEISRFAILPEYRKSRTFLPTVSLGLFKLVHDLLVAAGARYMVICSKPERIWTYEWMRFQRTGLVARYAKLANTEHELLSYDFRRRAEILDGHPFADFFVRYRYPEVVVPPSAPPFGLVGTEYAEPTRLAVGA
jgi:N-acyl-L-homoserine lactone synthetase